MDPTEIARLVVELRLAPTDERPVVRVPSAENRNDRRRLANVVVGKIFDNRVANRETLRSNLPRILQLRREADIEIVGDNLFAINFGAVEDRRRALLDGPWHYFKSLMLFKESSGLQHPTDVRFDEFRTWVQLHNLPVACMTPMTVRNIEEKIGKVLEVDVNEGGSCLGQFARIRVSRPIEQPLQRYVIVEEEDGSEERMVLIRYERLPDFCAACGRVEHITRHCHDNTVNKDVCSFGPWLRAIRMMEGCRQRTAPPSRYPGMSRGGFRETSNGSSSATGTGEAGRQIGGENHEGPGATTTDLLLQPVPATSTRYRTRVGMDVSEEVEELAGDNIGKFQGAAEPVEVGECNRKVGEDEMRGKPTMETKEVNEANVVTTKDSVTQLSVNAGANVMEISGFGEYNTDETKRKEGVKHQDMSLGLPDRRWKRRARAARSPEGILVSKKTEATKRKLIDEGMVEPMAKLPRFGSVEEFSDVDVADIKCTTAEAAEQPHRLP